jgi:hypothetical protein
VNSNRTSSSADQQGEVEGVRASALWRAEWDGTRADRSPLSPDAALDAAAPLLYS